MTAPCPGCAAGFKLAGPGVGFHLLEATSWAEELVWFDPEQGCFQRVAMAKSDRWQILGWDGTNPALLSAYERRAVLAGLVAEAWQAAETWLRGEFGPVTIAGSDGAGPRLYLDSLGGLQLAHRGLAHLAAWANLPTWPDGGRGTT